jgi:hypothetical protein
MSTMTDLGTKLGAEFKADRIRLSDLETDNMVNSNGTISPPLLSASPASPQANQVALADGVGWDPLTVNGSSPYLVLYNGTAWVSAIAVPTAATGTNTNQIATTAFTQQEINALKDLLYAYVQD